MGSIRLSNCLLMSIYYWFITKNSRIVMYYNRKYKTMSFYVATNKQYIKFKRDKTKKRYCKILFYIYQVFINIKH